MTYHVEHVVVKDKPQPKRPVMTVGRIYPIMQEQPEAVDREDDEKSFEGEAEVKVVRRGRRPKPKASEDAEVK